MTKFHQNRSKLKGRKCLTATDRQTNSANKEGPSGMGPTVNYVLFAYLRDIS